MRFLVLICLILSAISIHAKNSEFVCRVDGVTYLGTSFQSTSSHYGKGRDSKEAHKAAMKECEVSGSDRCFPQKCSSGKKREDFSPL